MTISVVFDFDGSLATSFVGGVMFRGYTPEDKVAEAGERHKANITSLREYQEEVFDLITESTDAMSKRAADDAEIRSLASEVCDQVWSNGGSVAVASAGLDFYIQPVLDKANLGKIEVHSGNVVSDPTALPPFRYDYPSAGKACKGDWVTCKCEVIDSLKTDNSEVIFVGDGYGADVCAATNAADTVFATGRLLKHCNENQIPAVEFGENFDTLLGYVLSKTSENGDR